MSSRSKQRRVSTFILAFDDTKRLQLLEAPRQNLRGYVAGQLPLKFREAEGAVPT